MRFGFRELLFVLLMIGLLASSYFFVFRKANEKQQALRSDIAAKEKQLADLRRSTVGIGDLSRRIAELEKAIAFFESKLPQEKEMDKILREVWQLAQANRLQTKTIKTLKAERFSGYWEQPIQMSLVGDFAGFHAFLRQLYALPRITRINQLSLGKMMEADGQMQVQMTVSIFFEPDAASSRVAQADN